MTPEQAAEHARQWEARAATAWDERERAAALASARGWWQEHARLSSQGGQSRRGGQAGLSGPNGLSGPVGWDLGAPSQPVAPPAWGPPSGAPRTGRPAPQLSPQPLGRPHPGVPGATGFPDPTAPGYPGHAVAARRGGSGCAVAAIVVATLAVVAILITAFLVRSTGSTVADPTAPPSTSQPTPTTPAPTTDPPAPPTTTDPPSTPTTTEPPPPPPPTAEEVFRSGGWEKPLPDPVPLSAPIPAFDNEYQRPEDWLAKDGITGITVIPTDDPSLNCGLNYADASTFTYAGCYSTSYRDVLFVWWNSSSTVADRHYLVAHEYSHWIQWHDHFDVMNAASLQGFNENQAWKDAMESDASCRVLSWGGYDADVVARSASPCTTDGWYEGWILDAARSLGVQI